MQETGQLARVKSAGTKYVREIWGVMGPKAACGMTNIQEYMK
jgi:hypothetical protein